MSIGLILGLVGGGSLLIIIGIIVVKLKRAKKQRAENKILKNLKTKTAKVEKKKKKIREEHDEIENNIVNDPGSDHGVLPKSTKRKHNHGRRDPCGIGCPAYGGD